MYGIQAAINCHAMVGVPLVGYTEQENRRRFHALLLCWVVCHWVPWNA